jgi:hypothetical protein
MSAPHRRDLSSARTGVRYEASRCGRVAHDFRSHLILPTIVVLRLNPCLSPRAARYASTLTRMSNLDQGREQHCADREWSKGYTGDRR